MNSDFVIKEGRIIEYTGNGGDIVIPYGVIELDELNFTKAVHKYEYDSNGNILKDNVSYNFETKKLITSIYIPNSVKQINEDAFSELVNLRKITFAKNIYIYKIPKLAFISCKSLKYIDLPESVHYIDAYAFADCCDITVKIGSNCKVSPDIFGSGKYKSSGSKVVIPNDYKYKNEIPKDLLSSSNRTVSNTTSSNTYSSSSDIFDFDGFQIFLILMFFVYLVLFFISVSLQSGTMLIITIVLGIINIFAFLGS